MTRRNAQTTLENEHEIFRSNGHGEVDFNAVFKRLGRHISVSDGEIVQVRNSMKTSLRQFWQAD
ncbi:hypothetical protein [Mesorhizobium sp.]|uniref:hypothetical protein n=1 Tax=Mesorhizobium sp. TaxID=1871066 RepID=UPI0012201B35|nr:hypothetical protein [Mesorhizobium sp.]TIO04535.1 MAG: hypothetical protein E5X88_31265 [Mesorhizobium sp.]TIO32703.1 MAG: hypothetical protein E5X89_19005 [Mesorhizobium sp.]TIP13961.1 MAG: hypothetical protein E5X73_03405 [Mesorhizobium sp.]